VQDSPLGYGQVRVEMAAWSLNFRDLSMPRGGYPLNDKVLTAPPLIPLSDGAGRVVEVGPGVETLRPGDRVVSSFFQQWEDGELTLAAHRSALGGAIDGVLAERVVLAERGCAKIPETMTDAEAATVPCAGVTAWAALTAAGLRAGQTILVLGTGGVSLFALQLARASGATVLVTSSSDDKLARAKALGAAHGINYQTHPEWHEPVIEFTGGVGVDHVIEVGGPGTLARSMSAVRVGGTVSLIGVLSGNAPSPSPMPAMFRGLTVRGIYVGHRQKEIELLRVMSSNRIAPVIDRRFSFEDPAEVRAAYRYLKSGAHFGKVVIERQVR
jgi:NADPH:quinone reductase-like Zn-dependent oxidoreductase